MGQSTRLWVVENIISNNICNMFSMGHVMVKFNNSYYFVSKKQTLNKIGVHMCGAFQVSTSSFCLCFLILKNLSD